MAINSWYGISIVFVLLVISSFFVFGSLNNLSDEVDFLQVSFNDLINNKGFSEVANNISDSIVLVLVKKNTFKITDKVSGSVYVDSEGVTWSKGTAFSVGNNILFSASHLVEGTDSVEIKLVWKGKEYFNSVVDIKNDPNTDFALFKTNLSIPSVNLIENDGALLGAKIGFIGFPLNEVTPILHDGIVSSIRNQPNGFFWYTINSFINRGNSGGPVFLSDTGEVIGIVSSRQNEPINIPQLNADQSEFTGGEKILYEMLIFLSLQSASNSQVGIGQIIGINQRVVDNVVREFG